MNDAPCRATGCTPLPEPFVRLRYFYGKRLGVADLRDEQSYHAGRMRFHNRHLHGAGVLCGLRLSSFAANGASDSLVLRVERGAALDACGREIIVPSDMCIDLDAWFRKEQARRGTEWPGDLDGGTLELAVLLCYREETRSPEVAPRDPCAPGGGGTEYGRVEEGFELRLVPASELPDPPAPSSRPTREALLAALRSATGARRDELAESMSAQVARLIGESCEGSESDPYLVLGRLRVAPVPRNADTATDVSAGLSSWDAASITPPPDYLLSTEAIQELLLSALADLPRGARGDLHLEPTKPESGTTYRLVLTFTEAILHASLSGPRQLVLRRLTDEWTEPTKLDVELHTTDPRRIHIIPTNRFLEPDAHIYTLGTVASAAPILTDSLEPIYAQYRFRIMTIEGGLALEQVGT